MEEWMKYRQETMNPLSPSLSEQPNTSVSQFSSSKTALQSPPIPLSSFHRSDETPKVKSPSQTILSYSRKGHHYFFPLNHSGNDFWQSCDGLAVCGARLTLFVVESVLQVVKKVNKIEMEELTTKPKCSTSMRPDSSSSEEVENDGTGLVRDTSHFSGSTWTLVFNFLGFSLGGLVVRAALPSLMTRIHEEFPESSQKMTAEKFNSQCTEETCSNDEASHVRNLTFFRGGLSSLPNHFTKEMEKISFSENVGSENEMKKSHTSLAQNRKRASCVSGSSAFEKKMRQEKQLNREEGDKADAQFKHSWKIVWMSFFSLSSPHLGCRVPFPKTKNLYRCARLVSPVLPASIQELLLLNSFIEQKLLSPLYLNALKQIQHKYFVAVRLDRAVWSYSSAFFLTPQERMFLTGWTPKTPVVNKLAFPLPYLSSYEKVLTNKPFVPQTVHNAKIQICGETSFERTVPTVYRGGDDSDENLILTQAAATSKTFTAGAVNSVSSPLKSSTLSRFNDKVTILHFDSPYLMSTVDCCANPLSAPELSVCGAASFSGCEMKKNRRVDSDYEGSGSAASVSSLRKTVTKSPVTYPPRDGNRTPWVFYEEGEKEAMEDTTTFLHSLSIFPASCLEEIKTNGVIAVQKKDNSFPPLSTTITNAHQSCGDAFQESKNWINPVTWPEDCLPRERRMAETFLEGIGPVEIHVVDFTVAVEDFLDKLLRMKKTNRKNVPKVVKKILSHLLNNSHSLQLFPGKHYAVKQMRKNELKKAKNINGIFVKNSNEDTSKEKSIVEESVSATSAVGNCTCCRGEEKEDSNEMLSPIKMDRLLRLSVLPESERNLLSSNNNRISFSAKEIEESIPPLQVEFVSQFVAWKISSQFELLHS